MSSKTNEMGHISEELLEGYSMQQLSEAQVAPIEEHLLVCSWCQQHLNEVDEYIAAAKIAARQITEEKAAIRDLRVTPRRPSQWALPLTGGTLVTALLVLMYFGRPHATPQFEVTLLATRGVSTVAVAPAHTALTVQAGAPDIPAGSQVRLELADSRGKIVWQGTGETERGQITVQVKPPLDAGLYWFRVYESGRLRQEYGLQIK